jgi:hypothetical protein
LRNGSHAHSSSRDAAALEQRQPSHVFETSDATSGSFNTHSLMKVFHCDRCNQLLFFENSRCVNCGAALAYVPETGLMASLPADPGEAGSALNPALSGPGFRLCQNYVEHETCNWAVASEDAEALCRSCRLTRTIPDVSHPERRLAWFRLESAKRRLIFTLMALHLPLLGREDDPVAGLAFEFKADPSEPEAPRVLTGHANSVITVNIAEADDAERERRRHELGEPYRTLLGHLRHESGHYYWDRLIRHAPEIGEFRNVFGDERRDYADSLARHYEQGAPVDWQDGYVSAYSSAHPWEDWAETWAHYLHMIDALETAADNGLVLRPPRAHEPALSKLPPAVCSGMIPFDRLIDSWYALTYVLNNLNRSLGLQDAYPFVLSTPAVQKLRFVHDVISKAAALPQGSVSAERRDAMDGSHAFDAGAVRFDTR